MSSHHVCFTPGGNPACSGCNPCDRCRAEVERVVLVRAMIQAGFNGDPRIAEAFAYGLEVGWQEAFRLYGTDPSTRQRITATPVAAGGQWAQQGYGPPQQGYAPQPQPPAYAGAPPAWSPAQAPPSRGPHPYMQQPQQAPPPAWGGAPSSPYGQPPAFPPYPPQAAQQTPQQAAPLPAGLPPGTVPARPGAISAATVESVTRHAPAGVSVVAPQVVSAPAAPPPTPVHAPVPIAQVLMTASDAAVQRVAPAPPPPPPPAPILASEIAATVQQIVPGVPPNGTTRT